MISDEQIALVQQSFAKVVPISQMAAVMFYDKLFEDRPDFRALFPEDMETQRGKLITTLAAVVQSLHQIDQVIDQIEDLGRRHVSYNVKNEDYGPVGKALLHTLSEGLGEDWNPELEKAWSAAYAMLAKVMINAANQKAA